jgi:hypothetical protein
MSVIDCTVPVVQTENAKNILTQPKEKTRSFEWVNLGFFVF